MPGEADIAREIGENVDPDAIHFAREALRKDIGHDLKGLLLAAYARLAPNGPYSPDASAAGRRALRNAALDLFAAGDRIEGARLATRQLEDATNMTDEIAALGVLAHIPGEERETALDAFYRAHADEPLVIDKWFALQAAIPERGTLDRVQTLMQHKAFSFNNPNRMRALVGSFATINPTQFNAKTAAVSISSRTSCSALDAKNPQVAARLLSAFKSWRAMERKRRTLAKEALRHVAGTAGSFSRCQRHRRTLARLTIAATSLRIIHDRGTLDSR